MASANSSRVSTQVANSSQEQVRIVSEASKAGIALGAQKPTDFVCPMAMVDMKTSGSSIAINSLDSNCFFAPLALYNSLLLASAPGHDGVSPLWDSLELKYTPNNRKEQGR